MGLDLVASLGGLIVPPVFDFIKKKFLKRSQDTPEATMSALATTKPDILPAYLEAVVKHLEAKIKWFNRDVIGTPSQWVVNVRAAIRPIVVIVGLLFLVLPAIMFGAEAVHTLDPGTRYFFETVIASWFGDRLSKQNGS
jgi:hypothetical protein